MHSQRSLLHEDSVRRPLVEIEGTDPSGRLWRVVAPDHVAGDEAAVEPSEPVRRGCRQSAVCRSPPGNPDVSSSSFLPVKCRRSDDVTDVSHSRFKRPHIRYLKPTGTFDSSLSQLSELQI